MVANLLLACELNQHTQSQEILEKATEILNMKESNVNVPAAAPHDTRQQTRIARRLGIDWNISKYMKKAFDAIVSDLAKSLESGANVVTEQLDKLKKFLQDKGIRTDFIDNFAPPKIGFHIEKKFGWDKSVGSAKHVVAAMGFNVKGLGKAQASIFDFSMTFEVKAEAFLKVSAVAGAFNIDVIKAAAHFRATSQKIFDVPTDLGSLSGIIRAVNQFVIGTINKILRFLQDFEAKLDVYIKPAKKIARNIRYALDTVTDVQETLAETTQVVNEVLGMLQQGGLGDAILDPLLQYLDKALKPVEDEINTYFKTMRPTVLKFTGYVNQSLNLVDTKVAVPIRKGRAAAKELMDMYDNAAEKIVSKVKGKIEEVTNVLTTKLFATEDMDRIKTYSEGFKAVKEGVLTMKKWTNDFKAMKSQQDSSHFHHYMLVKILGFELADKYVMETLTLVKQAIKEGDAYDALSKLDPSLISTVSKQLADVMEKLDEPLRAVRAFVHLAQNGTHAVETLIKKGMDIANASLYKLGANLEDQFAGFLANFTEVQLENFFVSSLATHIKEQLTMVNFGKLFLSTINLDKLKQAQKASITVANIDQDFLKTVKLSQLSTGVVLKLSDFNRSNLQDIGLVGLVDLERKALKVIDLSPELLSTWGLHRLLPATRTEIKMQDFDTEKTSSMRLSDLEYTVLNKFTVGQLDSTITKDLDLAMFSSFGTKSLKLSDVQPARRPGGKSLSANIETLSKVQLKQIKVQDLTTTGTAVINKLSLVRLEAQVRDSINVSGEVLAKVLGRDLSILVPVMFDRLRINDLKPSVLSKLTLGKLQKDVLDTINLGSLTESILLSLSTSTLKDGIQKSLTLDKLQARVLAQWKLMTSLKGDLVKVMTLAWLEPSFLQKLALDSLKITLNLAAINLNSLSIDFRIKLKPEDVSETLLEALDTLAKTNDKFVNLLGKGKDFKGKLDSSIGRVKSFCKQHAEENLVGVVQGQMAGGIDNFKSVLTTVDMLKRGNESLCQALDTSRDVLDKIALPLKRMCNDIDGVKRMSLENRINLPLRNLEILLRGALAHGKQLSVDYVRQQPGGELVAAAAKAIPIAHRAKEFTERYIIPITTELEQLPIKTMVDDVSKLNSVLQNASSLSDNIKSYGEPGGSDFDTFSRTFPRMMANLDSLIAKTGHSKYTAKVDDVLKKLNTMETTAASWLEQVQNVIGDSADVRGLSLSGSCL